MLNRLRSTYLVLALSLVLTRANLADEPSGRLLLIGGGLLPNNAAVFEHLIEKAGGRERARFGVFPTAAKTKVGALRFSERLIAQGIPRAQIQTLDVTLEN